MSHTSWLEINLSRLGANLATVRRIVGPCVGVCCVVKADAYGLGAARITEHLARLKPEMLAVYSTDQAQELACRGVDLPLLILMPVRHLPRTGELARMAASGRLHLTIHDSRQLFQVNRIGHTLGRRIPVHLYLDTGMSRSGMNAAQMCEALDRSQGSRHVRVVGIYSHLATADTDPAFALAQLAAFDRYIADHPDRIAPGILKHVANTFATWRDHRFHHSMVRVGLGLLGYGDTLLSGQLAVADAPPLRPTVRWLSRINHVNRYPSGSAVGYGCTHHLTRDSILGIVPVGYGHGYPLALGNRAVARVLTDDRRHRMIAPVVGRVSMDQIVIDLTRCADGGVVPTAPASAHQSKDKPVAGVGSVVELIGNEPDSPCSLPKLAELAGSNCHEMLCRLSPHLPRRYVHTDQVCQPQADARLAGSTHHA